jgi:hypothetical protein
MAKSLEIEIVLTPTKRLLTELPGNELLVKHKPYHRHILDAVEKVRKRYPEHSISLEMIANILGMSAGFFYQVLTFKVEPSRNTIRGRELRAIFAGFTGYHEDVLFPNAIYNEKFLPKLRETSVTQVSFSRLFQLTTGTFSFALQLPPTTIGVKDAEILEVRDVTPKPRKKNRKPGA